MEKILRCTVDTSWDDFDKIVKKADEKERLEEKARKDRKRKEWIEAWIRERATKKQMSSFGK